jgi:hypothetical protein
LARDDFREEIMSFDSNKPVHLIDDCELTQDELEAASGGKPAKSPPRQLEYLKIELKEVFVTTF